MCIWDVYTSHTLLLTRYEQCSSASKVPASFILRDHHTGSDGKKATKSFHSLAWFTRFVSKTLKTQGLDLDTDRLSDRHLIWTLINFPYSTVQLFPSKLFWSFEYLYQLNFVLLSGPGACCLQSWLAAWLPAAAAWEPPGSLCSPAARAACQNPRGNHVPLANWHGNPSCLPPPPSPSDQRAAIRSVSPGLPLPKPAQALTSLQPVPETLDIQCQQPQLLLFQQCSAVVALVSSKQL